MAKAIRRTSKRVGTRQRAKVTKKVSRFKREARRTARKLKKEGTGTKRKEKDPLLNIPNNWPGKEEILRAAIEERKVALEEKKRRKEAAKKRREWEKKNPEKARVKRARAENRALQLEQAKKEAAKANQIWSAQLVKVLPRVNCILHVLDARAPLAGISHTVETLVKEHQLRASTEADPKAFKEILIVYVLNKIDLLPREYVAKWLQTLTAIATDEPRLKIRRRVALYTSKSTSAPGVLMQQLQTIWLRSASKHKITAAVTGFSSVGKHTIVRDLEVTSGIVSVHASSACPANPRSKIPGGKEFCLITLPTDSDLVSAPAKSFGCIFKPVETELPVEDVVQLVDLIIKNTSAVKLCAFYKVTKVTCGSSLLDAIAKKRGLSTADKQLDLRAAGHVVTRDLVSGKLPVAADIPSEGAEETRKARLGSEAVTVLTDALHGDLLKECTVLKSKLVTVPADLFATKDFKLARQEVEKAAKAVAARQEKDKRAEEGRREAAKEEKKDKATSQKTDDAYTFNDKDWKDDGEPDESMEEDEELSEDEVALEEDEEGEESEEDEEEEMDE